MGHLFPREKQISIGETSWYTEQNNFADMIAIAKKEKKPILTVFSATWCKPCQKLKKEVFSSPGFKKVADETLLLYIEQTDPKGMEYCKKNKIRAFPTVKLFSSGGALLETTSPKRTSEEFLVWIKDIKSGNNAYDIGKQLEKNPNDRELIMKLANKLAPFKTKEKMGYLEKLIELNPDPKDPLTQEAYEKMIAYAPFVLMTQPPEKRRGSAQKYEKHLKTLVKSYYPDKFRYVLKPDSGIPHITALYNNLGQYKKAYKFFSDYAKKLPEQPNHLTKLHLYSDAVNAMLHLDKEKEAEDWLGKIKNQIEHVKNRQLVRNISLSYLNIIETFIKFYAERKDIQKADQYAATYLEQADLTGQKRLKDYKRLFFAKTYGIYLKQTLKIIDQKLEKGINANSANLVCDKARILHKMGQPDQAKKIVTDFYKSGDYLKKVNPKIHSRALNNLAWVFVELEMIDKTALEIAEKSVKLEASANSLDTLARIQAHFGNLKKAIELEKRALGKAESDYHETEFKKMITKWENMVK
jgi:thioredoxin-related protein